MTTMAEFDNYWKPAKPTCEYLPRDWHANEHDWSKPAPYCGAKIFRRAYCAEHYGLMYRVGSAKDSSKVSVRSGLGRELWAIVRKLHSKAA